MPDEQPTKEGRPAILRWWLRFSHWGRFYLVAGCFIGLAILLALIYPSDKETPRAPYVSPLNTPSVPSPSVKPSTAPPKASSDQSAPVDLTIYAKSHPEYALASIDSGVQLPLNDPRIALYKQYLDSIAKRSSDDRNTIADVTARCVQVAQKDGTRRESLKTNLGFLAEMNDYYEGIGKMGKQMSYRDSAAMLLMLNAPDKDQ